MAEQQPNQESHRPKVALVTGASGFIGSQLVRILLAEGVKVRALIQKGVPLQNLDGLAVDQIPGDLLDEDSLAPALTGCDTLFHLAAIFDYWLPEPAKMYRVNVEGTARIMEAARKAGMVSRNNDLLGTLQQALAFSYDEDFLTNVVLKGELHVSLNWTLPRAEVAQIHAAVREMFDTDPVPGPNQSRAENNRRELAGLLEEFTK